VSQALFHENVTNLTHCAGYCYMKGVLNSGLFETFAFLNDCLLRLYTSRHHLHHRLRRGNESSHMYLNISDRFVLIKLHHLRWNREFQMFLVIGPRHYVC
jgi:hypothetical protein